MKISFNYKLIVAGAVLFLIALALSASAAVIKNTTNGFMVYNLTRYDSGNLTLNNVTFSLYVNYLTPNYAELVVNKNVYELYPRNVINLKNVSRNHYYMNMTTLSWTPILQAFNLNIYDVLSPSNTVTTVATTTVSSMSTVATTVATTIPTTTVNSSNTVAPKHNNNTANTPTKTKGLSVLDYEAIMGLVGLVVVIVALLAFLQKRKDTTG
jgi:hypothetical protein